jgi:hypothetical protein
MDGEGNRAVSLVVLPAGRAVEPHEGRAVCELDDGRLVVWEPETCCGAIACHAQRLDLDSSPEEPIVEKYGLPRSPVPLACAWTRAEVAAKLLGTTPLAWLARGARARARRVKTVTMVRPELGIVVSLGMLPHP